VQLFSTSAVRPIGITPESENTQATTGSAAAPADLTDGKYHELADHWLENALVRFEDLQDAGEDIDIEFSVRQGRSMPTSTE
jgi:frataxin